jgi:hypothetical protein
MVFVQINERPYLRPGIGNVRYTINALIYPIKLESKEMANCRQRRLPRSLVILLYIMEKSKLYSDIMMIVTPINIVKLLNFEATCAVDSFLHDIECKPCRLKCPSFGERRRGFVRDFQADNYPLFIRLEISHKTSPSLSK